MRAWTPPAVAFLFTDVQDSTRAWNADPDAMSRALAAHDAHLTALFAEHGGQVFSQAGDSFGVAFDDPPTAVEVAVEAQRALRGQPVRIRVGLHVGAAEQRAGGYFGPEVNRGARIMGLADGGQILLSQAVREHVGDGLRVEDLGEQHLSGFDTPTRVFQIVHPDLPGDHPPLPGLGRGNLPAPATAFVGRSAERRTLAGHLETAPLVTVLGPGGIGKTRLAVETARSLRGRYPDGVWFVDLAPLHRDGPVAATVAESLGVTLGEGSDPLAALVNHVTGRDLLVILDNCEHVLEGAAGVADRLVGAAVHVLATSRERLRVPGERVEVLGPLDASSPDADAVTLFVERAEQVAPGAAATAGERRLVAEVCRRLDGIPLAIELAASRMAELPLPVIEERLADRLDLLGRDAAPRAERRDRSLRATIRWSHDLLPARTRAVFDRLAVFAGHFTVEDAQAVAADERGDRGQVLDDLATLVGASLVVLDRAAAPPAFRLLESFRAFGVERLAERGELAATRDRHATHVLWALEHLAALPYDRRGIRRRRDGMRALTDDVFAAMEWLLTQGDIERLERGISALSELAWEHRPRESVRFFERAIGACAGSEEPAADNIRGTAALMLFFLDSPRRAREVASSVVVRHDARGTTPPVRALVALALGRARFAAVEEARAAALRLAARGRATSDAAERLLALGFGGWTLAVLGDHERGIGLSGDAVGGHDGSSAWILAVSNAHADTLAMAGRRDEAVAFCRDHLERAYDLTAYGWINMLRILAQANLLAGRFAEAAERLRALLVELLDAGDVAMVPLALELSTAVLVRSRQAQAAARVLGAAERLRGDDYLGVPGELAARSWLHDRLRELLGDDATAELRRGAELDHAQALDLALRELVAIAAG